MSFFCCSSPSLLELKLMSWNTSRSLVMLASSMACRGLVDALAVARAVPLVVQGVEARVRRQDEAFALEHLGDQLRVITVLLLQPS